MTTVAIVLVLLVVLLGGAGIAGVALWRSVARSATTQQLTRQVKLELAGETARSPAHRAATGWRQALHAELTQTHRALADARRADAPLADLGTLVGLLDRSITDLDRELALLAREPSPERVDLVLRTNLGQRAEELVQTATRLREALARSVASGSAFAARDLVDSTDLSVAALTGALDELDARDPAAGDRPLRSSQGSPAEIERTSMTENATDQLTCPKCHGVMRRYERSNIVIDQCSDCRGIFLDAGELEAIMKAEEAHYRQPAPPQQQPQQQAPQQGYPQQGYPQQGYGSGGFLGGLFGGHHGGGHHGNRHH